MTIVPLPHAEAWGYCFRLSYLGVRHVSIMMNDNNKKIILASKSPRRIELLSGLGLDIISIPSDIDESKIENEAPTDYAKRLASLKAEKTQEIIKNNNELNKLIIIGADTIVVFNNNVLGKPRDKKTARLMISTLSGNYHIVYTAYTIISQTFNKKIQNIVRSDVKFKKLSDHEIEGYINTDEPYDKAGGYAAQGIGAFLIEKINGSFTNVVGLPLCEVVEDLRVNKWIDLF